MQVPCCLSLFNFICSELLWLLSSCSPGLVALGASPGLLGGFGAGKSVCSCCPGAARRGILRSVKRDVYGQMAAKNLNKQV